MWKEDKGGGMMERLTYRGSEIMTEDGLTIPSYSDYPTRRIIERLAEYEDLEEQGLLLRLPCKVGDIVYSITRDFISEYTICSIEVYNDGFFFCWKCEKGIYINVRGFTNYQIGKDVFLTQAEAERKLKKMESD